MLASLNSRGDVLSWTSVGPSGGMIDQVVLAPTDPNVIYLCNKKDGVFKTTDSGKLWSQISSNRYSCTGLWVDSKDPNVIYRTSYNILYKSTDGGKKWSQSSFDPQLGNGELFNFKQFLIHSKNSKIVYASGHVYGSGDRDLMLKSDNEGFTWSKIGINVAGCNFSNESIVAVDPQNPEILYSYASQGGKTCGSDKSGFYKSINGGNSWSLMRSKANWGPLWVDKSDSNTLYLYNNGSSIFRSGDGGSSWTELKTPENSYGKIDVDFFGSLYCLSVAPKDSGYKLLLFRSDDKGNSWIELKSDFLKTTEASPPDYSFGFSEKDKNLAYLVGGENGVLKSSNRGISWGEVNNGLYAYSEIGSYFAVNNSRIYAAVERRFFSAGIYSVKSENNGKDWESFNDELLGSANSVYQLVQDPFVSEFLILTDKGLFIHDNADEKWRTTSLTGGISHLLVDEETPGTLYAVDDNQTNLFISTNHAKTWELFAEVEDKVSRKFKKENLGSLATLVTDVQSFRSLKSIKVSAANSGIYAISILDSSANIKKSTDNRKTWTTLFQSSSPLNDIEFIPQTETIYRASSDGVSRSTDLGKTWEPLNNGFSDLNVVSLQLDESTGSLYAGTRSNQIFKMEGVAPPLDLTAPANSSAGGCALIQSTSSLAMNLSPRGEEKWFGSILFLFGVGILFLKRRILCRTN